MISKFFVILLYHHWHGDTFDLPDGAVRLTSSEHYENQAISVQECNWITISYGGK